MRISLVRAAAGVLLALLLGACGETPISPTPNPGGGGQNTTPPPNNPPVVESITIQGTRSNEPTNFADIGEAIAVSAKVRDDETAVDQLQYTWTATAGTFSGTGANVTWTAPSTVPASPLGSPGQAVTISLTVLERYGPAPPQFEHRVTGTATLSLHDSRNEVGEMAWQFLMDFSDSNIRDVSYIMRNFSRARCPQPSEVDHEFSRGHHDRQRIFGAPRSRSRVFRPRSTFAVHVPSTANAATPVRWCRLSGWISGLRTNVPGSTRGNGGIAAAYAPDDQRWWLCASTYHEAVTIGPRRYR